jgi:O-acetyl-ADP-ribose deacetylase (regulator of RNase III)
MGGKNNEEALLADCYSNSLKLAAINQCKTIAFPNISTGVYHFPKEQAATISVNTVTTFLKNNDNIRKVIFVCFDEENYSLFNSQLNFERND